MQDEAKPRVDLLARFSSRLRNKIREGKVRSEGFVEVSRGYPIDINIESGTDDLSHEPLVCLIRLHLLDMRFLARICWLVHHPSAGWYQLLPLTSMYSCRAISTFGLLRKQPTNCEPGKPVQENLPV